MPPVWNYFGYDEPNYTYAPNGKKLLGELAALSPKPAYVRVHNLLTTGDGSASLKWGSTNVYTEDAAGKPVYSWTILDRIFDSFQCAGIKPLVEIGFMPEALSTHPEPYRHNFPQGSIYTGWAYPPKDYQKVGGSRFSVCPSSARALWRRRSERPGSGKFGTSPTSTTGRERRRNISSFTISAWTRSCARFPKPASAARTAQARQSQGGRILAHRFSIIARISPTM